MQPHSYLAQWRHSTQRTWLPYGIALALLVVIGTGILDRLQPPPKVILPLVGLLLAWLAWEMYQGVAQYWVSSREGYSNPYTVYAGLGFALLASCVVLTRLTGGLYSPFYPLIYLTMAFLASIGTSRQGAMWFGYAIFLECAALIASGPFQPGVVGIGALHLLFFALFAGSHHIFLQGILREMSEARNRKRTVEHPVVRATHPPSLVESLPATGATALSMASIDEDRQILLSRLKEGLDAHGCALLWLTHDNENIEVMGIETDATHFQTGPFSARSGVIASLFKGESILRLYRSGEHPLQLPYYDHDVQVLSWLAIPIRQGQEIRGALCLDRIHPMPFSARDELLLEATTTILARAILNERTLQREAQDLEHLTQLGEISQQLADAPTIPALAEIGLELAATLVPYQWGLLTQAHDPDGDSGDTSHTVLATTPEVGYLYDQTFDARGTLLSLACKFGSALPKQGMLETNGPLLSETPLGLPDVASLTIIPLQDRHGVIGCLVLGSEEPGLFANHENEKKLEVFAQQLAQAFTSIQSQQQLDLLSHCDSLTGLINHSTFMDGLTLSFAPQRGALTQPPPQLALMMFNIDHFQMINERYGHETGDLVLKRIAKLFRDLSEPGDIVARYSGEELAFLCKGFHLSQALKYADHICQQVARIDLCSSDVDPEVFSVTISAGLACSPEHAADPHTLLRHANEALLQAKQRGGNQAVLFANSDDGVALGTPNPDARPSVSPPPGWGWGSLPPSDDPQQLRDPERWSLSSFSHSGDQHDPYYDPMDDAISGSYAVLQPAQLAPAPQPTPHAPAQGPPEPAIPSQGPLPQPTPHMPPTPEAILKDDTNQSTPAVVEELQALHGIGEPDPMAAMGKDPVAPGTPQAPSTEEVDALGAAPPLIDDLSATLDSGIDELAFGSVSPFVAQPPEDNSEHIDSVDGLDAVGVDQFSDPKSTNEPTDEVEGAPPQEALSPDGALAPHRLPPLDPDALLKQLLEQRKARKPAEDDDEEKSPF